MGRDVGMFALKQESLDTDQAKMGILPQIARDFTNSTNSAVFQCLRATLSKTAG